MAKKTLAVVFAVILVGMMPFSVYALTPEQLDKFAQNDILFYDPDGSDGSGEFSSCTGGNRNYAGATVWSEAELEAISANQSIYEEAAEKYNFPWQIMAVLHSHETGLRRYNPGNGQGVYQLYSYTAGGTNENRFEPADSISEEEFRRQTIIAAEVVSGMVGDLNEPANIKKLFFRYNGVADVYIQKAIAMGFSEEEANNGEGSAYVMNRYDARRDPTSDSMDSHWPGRFVGDGDYDSSATTSGFGAFVQYEALAGAAGCTVAGGSISAVALNLSWEGLNSHSKDDPKSEYVDAMKAVGAYSKGNGYYPYGASCDQFVGTVMRYSGADQNYPIFGPGVQKDWMDNHPDMYEKVDAGNDFTLLQPGDIFVTTNAGAHIYIYLGIVNGEMMQASASADDRTAEYFNSVYFSDPYGNEGATRYYDVYRRVDYE